MFRRFLLELVTLVWDIGFVKFDETILDKKKLNVQWVKNPYKDRWFADPFILKETENEYHVLVEEFCFKIKRGRIARIVIDKRSWSIIEMKIVLDLETHLSFPAIFRAHDKIFVYPENSASGKLNLYLWNEVLEKLELVDNLSNNPLTDAVISTDFDRPYLFSTSLPTPNENTLSIYSSDLWNGAYTLCSTQEFDEMIARGAGNLFKLKNKIIRPSQDCTKHYGHGIVLSEVIYKNGSFTFKELKRLYPDSWAYRGIHTFNVFNNVVVVDRKRYKYLFMGTLLHKIKHLFRCHN